MVSRVIPIVTTSSRKDPGLMGNSARIRRSSGVFLPLYPPFHVISDSHFYHDNIVNYCDRPQNHNDLMLENWIGEVKKYDTILHLGDLFFGGALDLFKDRIAPLLTGKKYIILGNHDKPKTDWESLGFTVVDPFMIPYEGFSVEFDHYPADGKDTIRKGWKRLRVHGHIHNNGYGDSRKQGNSQRKYGNVNVSVEMVNYTPVPVTGLLDRAIKSLNPKPRYRNVSAKARESGLS